MRVILKVAKLNFAAKGPWQIVWDPTSQCNHHLRSSNSRQPFFSGIEFAVKKGLYHPIRDRGLRANLSKVVTVKRIPCVMTSNHQGRLQMHGAKVTKVEGIFVKAESTVKNHVTKFKNPRNNWSQIPLHPKESIFSRDEPFIRGSNYSCIATLLQAKLTTHSGKFT